MIPTFNFEGVPPGGDAKREQFDLEQAATDFASMLFTACPPLEIPLQPGAWEKESAGGEIQVMPFDPQGKAAPRVDRVPVPPTIDPMEKPAINLEIPQPSPVVPVPELGSPESPTGTESLFRESSNEDSAVLPESGQPRVGEIPLPPPPPSRSVLGLAAPVEPSRSNDTVRELRHSISSTEITVEDETGPSTALPSGSAISMDAINTANHVSQTRNRPLDLLPFNSHKQVEAEFVTPVREGNPDESPKEIDPASDLTETILQKFANDVPKRVAGTSGPAQAAQPSRIIEQIAPRLAEITPVEVGDRRMLKMRLHPAELGSIEIELERDSSGTINARFHADSAAAQHILVEALDQLRDALQNSGHQVGHLNVETGQSSTAGDSRQSGRDHTAVSSQTFIAESPIETMEEPDVARSSGIVSLRA